MTTKTAVTKPRMTAADRVQQLLRAAVTAFAEGGYAGTTTDQVARLAGVSQPYVVRVFGTKQALFLAVYRLAGQRIEETFRAAAAAAPPDLSPAEQLKALGAAYVELVQDRELLSVMLHGFAAAADPALGPDMRRSMIDIYRLLGELTGAADDDLREFLARGMLINTMVALRMPDHLDEDPVAAEMARYCLDDPADSRTAALP